MSPPPPDAALTLTATPEEFLAAAHADMARAKAEIARLSAMTTPRETDDALAAFDGAMALLGDAAARASVCRNAHPEQAMRDAADRAEQEIEALQTEISLERGVYDALAALDLGGQEPATHHYVGKTLRDLRRAGANCATSWCASARSSARTSSTTCGASSSIPPTSTGCPTTTARRTRRTMTASASSP